MPKTETETTQKGAVRIEVGDYFADMSDDPAWSFLEATGAMAGPNPGTISALRDELVALVVRWNIPAKVAGKDGEISWEAGQVPPVSVAGMRSLPAKLILQMVITYNKTFSALPNEAAAS